MSTGQGSKRNFRVKPKPGPADRAGLGFRPMRERDLEAVSEIEAGAYEFPWTYNAFEGCLKIGHCCLVGEKAGRVVAFGIMRIGAVESHILNVCVSPALHGQGYGRAMMEKLMQVAKAHHTAVMILEVRPSNLRAVKLYQNLGFSEVGIRQDYYPAKDGREDALLLARLL